MLPILERNQYKEQKQVIDFLGYSVLPGKAENELSHMKNLSSDLFPRMTNRKSREVVGGYLNPTFIGSYEGELYYVADTGFYYKDVKKADVTAGEKQIVVMNNYIVIFPDKKAYDIVNDKVIEMENEYKNTSLTFLEDCIVTTGNDFVGFEVGDGIKITGCQEETNNKTVIIKKIESKKIFFGENTFKPKPENVEVALKREVPDLEFVIEHENRLWGCKGNEIFASRQGSCINFNVFAGVNSDSYAAEVGTEGKFTGAINYNNTIMFMKENVIHKVYGNKPRNYQIVTQNDIGVKKDCHKSIVIAGGILFYYSHRGVVAYNGAGTDIISRALGEVVYEKAVAGTDGKKYYISLQAKWGNQFLVYDLYKRMWHLEDAFVTNMFVFHQKELLCLSDGDLVKLNGKGELVAWEAHIGPFEEYMPERVGYSKLILALELGYDGECAVSILYDKTDKEFIRRVTGGKQKRFELAIQPRRCDEMVIILEGKGDFVLKSLRRSFKVRSDTSC